MGGPRKRDRDGDTDTESETQKQGELRMCKQALSGCESPFQLCAMSPPEALVESVISQDPKC